MEEQEGVVLKMSALSVGVVVIGHENAHQLVVIEDGTEILLQSVRSRIGSYDGHRDRYDRYMDDRRDGGRYSSYRDCFEGGGKYEARDLYPVERYGPPGDRLVSDRYGMPERHHHHLEDEYGRGERGYDRDIYSSDRYGAMGRLRDEGRGYRSRAGPYDRPSRSGGRSSSYERC